MLQVGVDCEEISRFRRLPFGENERFYRRIFTPREIWYCTSFRDPYPRFAARFAAKEAAIKALNGKARLFYTDVEVLKGSSEQPKLRFRKKDPGNLSRLRLSVSLSHSDSHAVAFIVATDSKYLSKKVGQTLKHEAVSIMSRLDGGKTRGAYGAERI